MPQPIRAFGYDSTDVFNNPAALAFKAMLDGTLKNLHDAIELG